MERGGGRTGACAQETQTLRGEPTLPYQKMRRCELCANWFVCPVVCVSLSAGVPLPEMGWFEVK